MTGDCADLTGQIFGELTALSVTHVGKKRSWMCQCSCGNTRTVQTFQLNAGHVRLCSERKNHLITKIGDRFGKLVVTDINSVGAVGRFTADCVCDCGKTYRTAIKNLQRGSATRCRKCIDYSHRNKLAPGVSLRNMHFGQYKHNAKTKGLEFTLTGEKFDLLTSNNCYFCGTPPKAVMTRKIL